MKVFVTDKYRVFTFLLICAVIVTGGIFASEETATVSSATKIVPIYSVERDDGKIAITFDCAWGADDMESILVTLKKHNCKATFFVLGTWAEQNPDIMKKLVSEGHEIGNHSYNHVHYTAMSQNEMFSDIDKCNKAIKDASGVTPTLFRAPSGDYNNDVIEAAHGKNMEYIQWSVDSLDWRGLNCAQMLERIIAQTKSGDILLFHNSTAHTAQSLDKILTELEKKGFSYLQISELIYKENYTIDHTGRQTPTK